MLGLCDAKRALEVSRAMRAKLDPHFSDTATSAHSPPPREVEVDVPGQGVAYTRVKRERQTETPELSVGSARRAGRAFSVLAQ